MNKQEKLKRRSVARTNAVFGLIVGAAYGAAITLQFDEYRSAKKARAADASHRLYELNRKINELGYAVVAVAEQSGMDRGDLPARAQEIWNRDIEEAIHGKTS